MFFTRRFDFPVAGVAVFFFYFSFRGERKEAISIMRVVGF